jgi:hypothetical protein
LRIDAGPIKTKLALGPSLPAVGSPRLAAKTAASLWKINTLQWDYQQSSLIGVTVGSFREYGQQNDFDVEK